MSAFSDVSFDYPYLLALAVLLPLLAVLVFGTRISSDARASSDSAAWTSFRGSFRRTRLPLRVGG